MVEPLGPDTIETSGGVVSRTVTTVFERTVCTVRCEKSKAAMFAYVPSTDTLTSNSTVVVAPGASSMFVRVRSQTGAAPAATSLRCVIDRVGRGPARNSAGATRGGGGVGVLPGPGVGGEPFIAPTCCAPPRPGGQIGGFAVPVKVLRAIQRIHGAGMVN